MTALMACGPVLLPLLALSVMLVAVALERGLFWWRWLRASPTGRRRLLADPLAERLLEPLLEAIALLAPLVGILGTVLALMRLLDSLQADLSLPGASPGSAFASLLASTSFGLVLAIGALLVRQLNRGLRRWQQSVLAHGDGA